MTSSEVSKTLRNKLLCILINSLFHIFWEDNSKNLASLEAQLYIKHTHEWNFCSSSKLILLHCGRFCHKFGEFEKTSLDPIFKNTI